MQTNELHTQIEILQAELAQARTLQDITRTANAAHSEEAILEAIAQPAMVAGAVVVSLAYIEVGEDDMPAHLETVAAISTQPGSHVSVGMRLPWSKYALAQVWDVDPDLPCYIEDAWADPDLEQLARFGIRAEVAIPLRQDGRWMGMLTFDWREPHAFNATERALYDALPVLATAAIENQRLISNLERMVATRASELQEHQFLFQTFLDNFPDLAFAKDMQGRILLSNRALERAFAVESGALIGKTLNDFVPEAVADEMWESEKHVLDTQTPQEVEEVLPIEGKLRTKLTVKFPLYDAQGKVYAVGGISRDVTARKQAEDERARLQQEVIESQRRALQEMATPIIPIISTTDGSGNIIVMPLVGSIDSMRAKDVMRSLLAGISTHRAKIVIVDITGVPIVDTGVINHLNKTIQAARLKGARTIVTGVSDAVAEAIIDLGIDWSHVITLSDLQTGLLVALRSTGFRLTKL